MTYASGSKPRERKYRITLRFLFYFIFWVRASERKNPNYQPHGRKTSEADIDAYGTRVEITIFDYANENKSGAGTRNTRSINIRKRNLTLRSIWVVHHFFYRQKDDNNTTGNSSNDNRVRIAFRDA